VNARDQIHAWAGQGRVSDVRTALHTAGVTPTAADWRALLDRLLLWSGAVALAAAVVFFVAHNWSALGRFAKLGAVELLLVAASLGYWKLRPERAAGKASLVVAAVLVGALLALVGQTYQTGADTWELYATWAAFIVPWVLIGRCAALWLLWLAIANAAIVLYFTVFPGLFGALFATEHQLWTLFAFNTAALVVWELASRRYAWLSARWAPRAIAIASGACITVLALHAIFSWPEAGVGVAFLYPVWIACAYAAYRLRTCDLLVLAGLCVSVIVVVTGLLSRVLFEGSLEAGGFLGIALVVIAMATAAAWWLKAVASAPGA
jgi:uncharacterized membrane protein